MGLTPRQSEALAYIKAHRAQNGDAPSFDEIRQHMKLASKSSVANLLDCLEERGAIRRKAWQRRSIEVVA